MSLAEMPEMLTLEEARGVLRISRTAAYELARRFEETGGREGLPVVRLGRSLRVPRAALARLIDPVAVPPDDGLRSRSSHLRPIATPGHP